MPELDIPFLVTDERQTGKVLITSIRLKKLRHHERAPATHPTAPALNFARSGYFQLLQLGLQDLASILKLLAEGVDMALEAREFIGRILVVDLGAVENFGG